MKALVQRVKHAAVTINGGERRAIGPGLLIFYGVRAGDDEKWCQKLAEKCANLRVFSDEAGKMNLCARELGYEALVISQFTLFADTKKGNRPSFIRAAAPEFGNACYEKFLASIRERGLKNVKCGEFGAHMDIELVNDGPVTIMFDTDEWAGA